MLNRLDSAELSEWMAYNQIEPFGAFREDTRFALLGFRIAQMWCSSKNIKITDFMVKFGAPEEQTDEEIKQTLMTLTKPKGTLKKDK